jgi:hypothetical protein
MKKLIFLWSILFLILAHAMPLDATEQDILNSSLPKLKLQLVPQNYTFDSPNHQYRTQRSVRADFNGDGTPDIAICAVQKTGDNKFDGYLIIASFRKGEWRPALSQKFPAASGPSLKWDSKRKQLFFFLSFTKTAPLELLWDARQSAFYLGDVDAKMKL